MLNEAFAKIISWTLVTRTNFDLMDGSDEAESGAFKIDQFTVDHLGCIKHFCRMHFHRVAGWKSLDRYR